MWNRSTGVRFEFAYANKCSSWPKRNSPLRKFFHSCVLKLGAESPVAQIRPVGEAGVVLNAEESNLIGQRAEARAGEGSGFCLGEECS